MKMNIFTLFEYLHAIAFSIYILAINYNVEDHCLQVTVK